MTSDWIWKILTGASRVFASLSRATTSLVFTSRLWTRFRSGGRLETGRRMESCPTLLVRDWIRRALRIRKRYRYRDYVVAVALREKWHGQRELAAGRVRCGVRIPKVERYSELYRH